MVRCFLLVTALRLNFLCIFKNRLNNLWTCKRQGVPKRRHIIFRRQGITLKKEYDIHNKVKV